MKKFKKTIAWIAVATPFIGVAVLGWCAIGVTGIVITFAVCAIAGAFTWGMLNII